MNARSSKLQASSSREAPSAELQDAVRASAEPPWWGESGEEHPLALREDAGASPARHPWDLEERTARFGERIVRFSKRIPRSPTNDRLIDQLVGAGTSIGGNYCEANEGVSKKDFRFSASRCVKEAKETKFFLRMVVASEPQLADEARPLYREAHELLLIFASMRRS
jgi:four helix bundle protein